MKETLEDVYEMGRALKELDADSIPVSFLHAIDGTALEGTHELNPMYCLKVLALFRFMNPTKEIRISGGREVNLRSLQPLGLFAADRKSTRLNSSHVAISYAVFCLKKKKQTSQHI